MRLLHSFQVAVRIKACICLVDQTYRGLDFLLLSRETFVTSKHTVRLGGPGRELYDIYTTLRAVPGCWPASQLWVRRTFRKAALNKLAQRSCSAFSIQQDTLRPLAKLRVIR